VRLNGISIIEYFNLNTYNQKALLKTKLIQALETDKTDSYFSYGIINALNGLQFNDKETIDLLLNIIGQNRSSYTRSAMYVFIGSSPFLDEYADYYIEGMRIIITDENNYYDQDNIRLGDETLTLFSVIAKFKTAKSLKQLLNFYIENFDEMDTRSDFDEKYKTIIENCILAYQQDSSIYEVVLKLCRLQCSHWRHDKVSQTMSFFEQTGTRQQAFNQILSDADCDTNPERINDWVLCYFMDENYLSRLIDAFNKKTSAKEKLTGIYYDLCIVNVDLSAKLLTMIEGQTNIKIPSRKLNDQTLSWKDKAQKSFNVLFDLDLFQMECIRVFEDQDKIERKNLNSYLIKNNKVEENNYLESALRLLRDLCRHNTFITKQEAEQYFHKKENLLDYIIRQIYFYLKGQKELTVSDSQIEYIQKWVDNTIQQIDFSKAITVDANNFFLLNPKAELCAFFIQKLNLRCKDDILLNMFAFSLDNRTISFDYLVSRLPKSIVDTAITSNVKNKTLKVNSIYQQHVAYIFKNHLIESYPIIFNDLSVGKMDFYKEGDIIDLYFKNNSDIILLKEFFPRFDFGAKATSLRWLIKREDIDFAQDALLKLQPYIDNKQDQKTVNNLLISCGCIPGLENSIRWIDEYKESPFSQHGQGLTYFQDIAALPYFMQLVERGYDKEIQTEHSLDRMLSLVLDGIQHLALSSKENFDAVCQSLQAFIQAKSGVLEEVEFLNATIERIKERFFQNYTPPYKIKDVKRMIKELAEYQ